MKKTPEKRQFNIMKHKLVPYHEILSPEKKEEILKNFNLTIDQLPKIMEDDPVCLSIGAKSGQIIKVIRKSHTAKEAVAFRLVVKSES